MKSPRLWIVILFLLASIALLHVRGDIDHVPPSTPLAQLPTSIGPWTGTSFPIDQETLDVLGKGVFLNRVYNPDKTASAADPGILEGIRDPDSALAQPISLFIGYFPTQRTGQSIHSPQNCLPGAGWVFESSNVTTIDAPGGRPMQVGEYVIANGASKAEVLYWYQTQGHSIASDYTAKLYMLADSIRYGRTDAALVRIFTPLIPGESKQAAHDRVVAFARQLSPLLPAYIPD